LISHKLIPAYDLETILEALPKHIRDDFGEYELDLYINRNNWRIAYIGDNGSLQDDRLTKEENESLADTAARLLILLHEKGIVKFNN
jgi:hypothetical protein